MSDSLGGEERSTYDDRGLLVRRILTQGSKVLRIDQTNGEFGREEKGTRSSSANSPLDQPVRQPSWKSASRKRTI